MPTVTSNGVGPIQPGTQVELATNTEGELAIPPPAHGKNGPDVDFQGNFVQIINGKSAPTKVSRRGINPATLDPMAEVPVATQEDLENAVTAAKGAFKVWSKTPYEDRRSAVLAFANAIESLSTEFRDLLISEQGKPVRPNLHNMCDKSISMC